MRKISVVVILSLAVAAALAPGAAQAKKKKTWCEKKGTTFHQKLAASSNGVSLYHAKGEGIIYLCQNSPKNWDSLVWEGGTKVGGLTVVKKKCVVFSELSATDPVIHSVDWSVLRNGEEVEDKLGADAASQLYGLSVAPNCAIAAGVVHGGAPQIFVTGATAFGYTGYSWVNAAAASTTELSKVKISGSSTGANASATVTWTAGGAPQSYTFSATSP